MRAWRGQTGTCQPLLGATVDKVRAHAERGPAGRHGGGLNTGRDI